MRYDAPINANDASFDRAIVQAPLPTVAVLIPVHIHAQPQHEQSGNEKSPVKQQTSRFERESC